MAQLRIAPGTAEETLLDASEITRNRFAKTHTGKTNYRVSVPYQPSLEDDALSEVYLEKDDGTLLFRGLMETISSDEKGATTNVSGPGPAYKLESSEVVFTVSNQLAHNAIADFWNNETAFSPTVTQPSVQFTTTGEQAQSASTNSEFQAITEIADTTPVAVQNDSVELLQSCFFQEAASNYSAENGATFDLSGNPDYVRDQRVGLDDAGDYLEFTFTVDYDIPAEHFAFAAREGAGGGDTPELEYSIDGQRLFTRDLGGAILFWRPDPIEPTEPLTTVSAGTHTLRIEAISTGTDLWWVDVVAPLDTRYSYTFDNTVDANQELSGPELYPDAVDFAFEAYASSWNITDGTLSTTFNDTSGNQRIQLRLGDQTWFPNDGTEDNTTSVTTSFGSEVGSVIQGRATLGRYGSQTDSPTSGHLGQRVESWTLTFDGNDIPVIGSETFEGNALEVAQDLHNRADMRYVIEHSKTSLPVYSFRAGDETRTLPSVVTDDEANRTTRSDFSEYFNAVTVRGQTVDDERLSASVEDSSEISTYGRRHFDAVDPSLKTSAQLEAAARALLLEKLREREKKGTITHPPVDLQPGFSYSNPFDTGTIPVEEVRYQISNGDIQGETVFDFRTNLQLGESFGGLRRSDRNTKLGF